MQDKCKYKRGIFLNHPYYPKYVAVMQQPKRMCSGIVNPSSMTQKRNLVDCLCISNFNLAKHMLYLWIIFQLFYSVPNGDCKNVTGFKCMHMFKGFVILGLVGLALIHPFCLTDRNNWSGPGNPSWYSSFTDAVTYTERVVSKVTRNL